jgi:mitochondrial enoyl-[acyl-carrier protein] reductase / trans-2-enoyl-CoA reductase
LRQIDNLSNQTCARIEFQGEFILDNMKSTLHVLRRLHTIFHHRLVSSYVVHELQADQYGLPTDVLKLNQTTTIDASQLKSNDVLIELLASPINPADINMIEGKYALLPSSLPATFGNEGVFQVLDHRVSNEQVQPGDWVIPKMLEWGKWRSHGIVSIDDLIKIPSDIGLESAATLSVNPCTAYRLLKDFVALETGDTIIQNGGNSGVGQAVIQLGKVWNINVVNIVRQREQGMMDMIDYLKSLGAEHIYVEEDLRKGM